MIDMVIKRLYKLFRHYFYPHESNNYRARALHNPSIIFYILLVLVFQLSIKMVKLTNPNILGYATDITVEEIINLVNQERTKNGLSPLVLSSELSTAATTKASDMFAKNYWAHISPTGTTPWVFIKDAGYDYLYAGENLARDFNFSKEVVEAWMNSSTHKANILKPEYTDLGLAIMNGKMNGQETTLVIQEFGSRNKYIANQENYTPLKTEISSISGKMISETKENNKSNFLHFYPSKTMSLFIAEFLLLLLFIDSIYIWRYKPARITGNTLSHIIFIAFLLGAMGATGVGIIL